jgi:SAM-dependent methyltransferase
MSLATLPTVTDELAVLEALVPLQRARIIEAGCGAARLARDLIQRHQTAAVVGIEVDQRQLAKNLLEPARRLRFERAGAEAIPFADASFDGAMMLKSLHHVPVALMDQALSEVGRVLRPGAWFYVSEPVYDGPLNELVRLFNDEREVRAAAQAALDRAVASGQWLAAAERRFEMPVGFASFEEFEQRMMRPTFADHGIDDAMVERVKLRYAPHQRGDGAHFARPMHVRLLRKAR